MSTTVSIAATTAAISAVNSAAASRRQDEHCQTILQAYDARTAQPQDMREYAACVQRLHPEPVADAAQAIVFTAAAVSAITAVVITYSKHGDGLSAGFMAVLAGVIVLSIGMVVAKVFGF